MAVYTEISDLEVAEFVSEYDVGRVVSYAGIAEGIENTNYLVVTEWGQWILTLYEKRVKSSDLPFFLSLLEFLAKRGVPCPVPRHGRDGAVLRRLAGRDAALVTFLPGLWPRCPTAAHCEAVGVALAVLHAAGADCRLRRSNDWSVPRWRELLDACVRHPSGIASALHEELDTAWHELRSAWPTALPRGIIHADLFPDNVFFIDGRISGLIDFYFACTDDFAYDLAVCLNAWCFEADGSLNVTKSQSLLTAYDRHRRLTKAERDALPTLACGAAMRFLLTRLHDWLYAPRRPLVWPKNPAEYVSRMRFHRGVRSASAYGLS